MRSSNFGVLKELDCGGEYRYSLESEGNVGSREAFLLFKYGGFKTFNLMLMGSNL